MKSLFAIHAVEMFPVRLCTYILPDACIHVYSGSWRGLQTECLEAFGFLIYECFSCMLDFAVKIRKNRWTAKNFRTSSALASLQQKISLFSFKNHPIWLLWWQTGIIQCLCPGHCNLFSSLFVSFVFSLMEKLCILTSLHFAVFHFCEIQSWNISFLTVFVLQKT